VDDSDDPHDPHIVLELTPDEATIVAAALRQFEPYWPTDLSDLTRVELLAGIRAAIDGIREQLPGG
jgi:hypothetical protein